jgi:hypothetical protein
VTESKAKNVILNHPKVSRFVSTSTHTDVTYTHNGRLDFDLTIAKPGWSCRQNSETCPSQSVFLVTFPTLTHRTASDLCQSLWAGQEPGEDRECRPAIYLLILHPGTLGKSFSPLGLSFPIGPGPEWCSRTV